MPSPTPVEPEPISPSVEQAAGSPEDAAAAPDLPGLGSEELPDAGAKGAALADRRRIAAINKVILAEDKRLRAKHRWLAHQNAIGAALFFGSLAAMAGLAWAWLAGYLAWWLTVPLMAFAVSILHELEHDLIHDLYFPRRTGLHNVAFFVIWLAKQNLNPWTRRWLHIRHHHVSGRPGDIEERLIGLGLPVGFERIYLTLQSLGSSIQLWKMIREAKAAGKSGSAEGVGGKSYPLASVVDGLMFTAQPVVLVGAMLGWRWAEVAAVLAVAPNMLRHACIVLMSSYSHYYGDIPPHDVFHQNQILDHPLLWPFQAFCFNFGATHIIHHYIVRQPFYLRQMAAKAAHAELLRQGARRNDFGVVARANRWGAAPQAG